MTPAPGCDARPAAARTSSGCDGGCCLVASPFRAVAGHGTATGWHNRYDMEAVLGPLLPLFERERAAGRALALGILVHTAGSTYRKPGALILIAADGDYAGLISGGCLEGDLREHALRVIADGHAHAVSYDLRGPDELLWGLGLGCEGRMRILLTRVGPQNDYQPLTYLGEALNAHRPAAVGLVCDSGEPQVPLGTLALPLAAGPGLHPLLASATIQEALAAVARGSKSAWLHADSGAFELFMVPLALPPRVLVLGAGADVAPLVDFAVRLNWRVTVADHRAAYASAAHFPRAQVVHARADELAARVPLADYTAAIVMSHHRASDLAYLRLLAATDIPYVGLLGPPQRRDRLLAELGPEARTLEPRLHAPVGLPLGGRTPEDVALAIVCEVQAFVQGRLAQASGALAALPRVAGAD